MKSIFTILLLTLFVNSYSQPYIDASYREGYNNFAKIKPTYKYELGYTHKYYSFGVSFGKAYLSQITNPMVYQSSYYEPRITINSNPSKLAFIAFGGYQIYSKLPFNQGMITLGLGAFAPIAKHTSLYLTISKADMNDYLSIGIHYSLKRIKKESEFLN